MKTTSRYCSLLFLIVALAVGGYHVDAQKAPAKGFELTESSPESVGFSSERLAHLHALMQQTVDQKQLPGIVTLLARHGKVIDYRAYGHKDMTTGAAMTKDAIFRDFSMTKPVTAVAMMILYEQGKWLPSDRISKYIPEFQNLKVFKGEGPDGKMILEDPIHQPTIAELLTHTAGFTYGFFGNSPGRQNVCQRTSAAVTKSAPDD
jgi:CubicO group peptidase (beta-lactamase class C family)